MEKLLFKKKFISSVKIKLHNNRLTFIFHSFTFF